MQLCDRILLRGVARLSHELPSLLPELFGDDVAKTLVMSGDDVPLSTPSVAKSDCLVFTPGEPACNVYTAGGQFTPHEDRQSLTILVPLSAPSDYTGGGTGYWSNDARGPTGISGARALAVHGAPSMVLKVRNLP